MTSALVVLALLVAGNAIAQRAAWLRALNIPGSFVGGIAGSLLALALSKLELPGLSVSGELRDLLLVLFFVSAGLGTKISSWVSAGRPLLVLSLVCTLMMVFQNAIGMSVAFVLGVNPAYGVLSGSVAFAGGLGSAVAWGAEFGAKGVPGATEVAVIAATVGMTVGTFVGGPYVAWIIRRKRLSVPRGSSATATEKPKQEVALLEKPLFVAFLLFAVSVVGGDLLGDLLRGYGVIMPRFLTAMLVGVGISSLTDLAGVDIDRALLDRCGDICLSLFIVMALCGVDLTTFGRIAGSMALMAAAQTLGMILFAHLLVFRTMGANFEAATTAGGVIGFGLSSFAVAMATVKQVEANFGPAPQARLLTTLVGGAVSNLANALVVLAFFEWLTG